MASAEVLQRAIQAARAGRKIEARDLLIQIVETDPENEMAWVWLSGLVDSFEDAKERKMSIVRMKGDKQHPDMLPRLPFREHIDLLDKYPFLQEKIVYPTINLLLIMSDDWEIMP